MRYDCIADYKRDLGVTTEQAKSNRVCSNLGQLVLTVGEIKTCVVINE